LTLNPTRGTLLRMASGGLTLGLSLVCVISCLPNLGTMSGTGRLTIWGFFLWGLFLASAGVWLIRGRSKGKALVFVRDRRRLVLVGVLAVAVVGLLMYFLTLPADGDDAIWKPLGIRTMFANLFGSIPFMLFDREDYAKKDPPLRWDQAMRRKAKRTILFLVVAGLLFMPAGLYLAASVHPWWDVLSRVAAACWAGAAVLGYRLKKAPFPEPDAPNVGNVSR
jgi:hypothetical protein